MFRIAAASVLALTAGWAQTDADVKFEAASVKAAPPGDKTFRASGGPGTSDPGRIDYQGWQLIDLIRIAYRLERFQIQGPDSIQKDRYSVMATVPRGATADQVATMWRNLLAERFHLQVRRDTKEMPVSTLVVAKGGPKLKEAVEPPAADAAAAAVPAAPRRRMIGDDGFPLLDRPGMMIFNEHARWRADGQTMAMFAGWLAGNLGQVVHDGTGLTGKYDLVLSWVNGGNGRGEAQDPGADLAGALEPQLGLKLETRKANVAVLVVEHADAVPVEN